MKSKKEIENNIDDTFKILDNIEEVKVNHFFKHKVLQQLENIKEEKSKILGWFSPQLQMATLGLVLLLNVGALFYAYSSQEVSNTVTLESFAQEYSLQSETNSILN
ncbi:hypothetical protein BW723_11270 [Polaribacter reichenbachii]|uniref:Uncharacterized protein n=1 Tax=Polaribacter reichenbachii TaxID=996801 RepID=A0A1B8TQ32_9FLAO|nr:hypothetical protein [Polaribacter reichenbachii]APZ46827.1 hypothetical protein BW723_11270 [Polaribacter reichenbachii]AUC17470.1 hypothetical protein BTO17_01715 [Polaribacter reichenbachii]OBY61654.1 hypothetical protein LPB301_16495 [Polaribacter reichenbachii]